MAAKTYGETRVNTYTLGSQESPAITALADGGYLVAWTSQTQSGRYEEIYAQRYDASNQKIGGETVINTTYSDDQCDPAMTLLNNGNYVIAWSDLGTGDVVFQRYSSTGSKLGGETRINSNQTGEKDGVSVTALKQGGFVATWESSNQDGSGYGIFSQRFDANGTKVGVETRVNSTITNNQWSATTAALGDGGYLVVWESAGQDGSGFGVYAQRFSSSGGKVGAETRVNTTTAGDQADPAVAVLAKGGYVITWQGNDGNLGGIYAQRYDASGNKLGGETRVNTTTVNDQEDPAITALSNGGYVITWGSYGQDGSGDGVYAQRFDASGNKVGKEVLINTWKAGDQEDSTVTALADGGYIIGWASDGQDGSANGIYTQRFDANGNKLSGLDGDANANTLSWTGSNAAILNGLAGNDSLTGGTGNDHLNGGAGDDRLNGGAGADSMAGGLGNDAYYVDNIGDRLTEAASAGNDTVYSYLTAHTLAANVENGRIMSAASANLTGNGLNNVLYAGAGNNVLNGGSGIDTVSYAYGLSGTTGVTVSLAATTAQATGGSGSDTLAGIESLTGSIYSDRLTGNSAANVLNGGAGNDSLVGGAGKDTLTGGTGNDTFDFNALTEMGTTSTNWDVISDFAKGDKIDLFTLDANTDSKTVNDAFKLIASTAAFTAAGQLKFANGVLYGNTDADSTHEFAIAIKLTGITSLTTADFAL